jgi:hypothetical protein
LTHKPDIKSVKLQFEEQAEMKSCLIGNKKYSQKYYNITHDLDTLPEKLLKKINKY